MSEDLIERLSVKARDIAFELGSYNSVARMLRDAVAELKRLRAKLADVKAIESSADYWAKRAEAAEKRLAEAEKVIEPFARIARIWAFDPSEGDAISVRGTHLRAAAEWMEKGDE